MNGEYGNRRSREQAAAGARYGSYVSTLKK